MRGSLAPPSTRRSHRIAWRVAVTKPAVCGKWRLATLRSLARRRPRAFWVGALLVAGCASAGLRAEDGGSGNTPAAPVITGKRWIDTDYGPFLSRSKSAVLFDTLTYCSTTRNEKGM